MKNNKPSIERINADKHLRIMGDFDCGLEEEMTVFLKNEALNYDENGEGNTFLILYNNCKNQRTIIAYFTLKANIVKIKDEKYEGQIRIVPSLEIARLAIDKDYQNKGYGKKIMKYIITLANEIKEKIAIKYIIVFSVESALKFYKEKFNFQEFEVNKDTFSDSDNEGCKPLYIVI
ncbi:TPA: GNAT family N-acetyltransferase [Clostridium botulinum]|nr:GNAT family N-acetyltransferase [Clostridium botulinum]